VSLLDLLLVVIVGASIAAGWVAGFARVGIGFIATVTGLLFGFWFYGTPAEYIHRYVHSNAISNLLGFLVVLFAFNVVGALVGKLLSKLFKWTGLSWLDRLMGGAFGLLRGGLMAIAFVAVLMAFTPRPLPNWMVESAVLPYAIDASNMCAALAPNQIKDAFRESMNDIRKVWDEQLKKKKKRPDLKPVDS
jgi:membrane protein required for colicin V production